MTNTEIVLAGTIKILINFWPVVAGILGVWLWEIKHEHRRI